MVFGLFSRKRAPAPSPAQLRTPSPSVVDKHSSPHEPPLTPSPPPEADASALRAHIQRIPPRTLHAYILAHLHPSSPLDPTMLHHLTTFFAALAPPPSLHCVRCHKAFFEIENTDRSCLVPHDDESAEVERVRGAQYETMWGCCGRTVEGDGDMGPPDGWCYEGMHTTDTKRARFRADSTMYDDKLVPCALLRCGMPPMAPPSSTSCSRKRARDEGDEPDEDERSVTSSRPSTHASPRSSNGRKKARTRESKPKSAPKRQHEPESNQMAIDPSPSATPLAPSPPSPQPNPKPRTSKPKPRANLDHKSNLTTATPSTTTSAPKPTSPLIPRPPSPDKVEVVIQKSSSGPVSPGHTRVRGSGLMSGLVSPERMRGSGSPERMMVRKESASPERTRGRKESGVSRRGKGKGKTRTLGEVVDSSVDGERAGWGV